MRYAVHDRDGRPLAMLDFSAAAWKTAPRDSWIGWSREQRERNLRFVANHARMLVLPWVQAANVGSHILALVRRRLPGDWCERYGYAPVLLETFVQKDRFSGGLFKASGWVHVGTTQGRGRNDFYKEAALPQKDIWMLPLQKNWRRILTR